MTIKTLSLTREEFDAVLAGIRMLGAAMDAGRVVANDEDIGSILTCDADHAGLSVDEVWSLGDRLAETEA